MKRHIKIRRFWRTWGWLIKVAALLGILLLAASCAKNTPASDYCLLYRPIYSSPQDTEETLRQIDDNNVVYDTLCDR